MTPVLFHEDEDAALHLYTLQAFQAQAARTLTGKLNKPMQIYAAAFGAISETGEIGSELKKAMEQERDVNWDVIREEIGDTLWYLAALCSIMGWQLSEVAYENICKLQTRYPTGFSPAASIARVDKHA